MGGLPAWGLGEVLTTPRRKKLALLRNFNTCLGPPNQLAQDSMWRALVSAVMNLRVP